MCIWKRPINPKRAREKGNTVFVRERRQKAEETFLPEEERREEKNCPHNEGRIGFHCMKQKGLIDTIFSRGSGWCVRDVCVRFLARTPRDAEKPSFYCICGKKSLPLATDRNTMRRRMRESVRKKSDRIARGKDVAVVFRGKQTCSFREVDESIEEALQKARLFV